MNHLKHTSLFLISFLFLIISNPTHGMVRNFLTAAARNPKAFFAKAAAVGSMAGTAYAAHAYAHDTLSRPNIVAHNFNAPLPEELKNSLNQHHKELDKKPDIKIVEWLEDWVIKRGGGRLHGAKAAADVINKNGFTHLGIPVTYEYTAPDGNVYTIAMLHRECKQPITLAETKQLWRFAKRAQWSDSHCGNFIKINENTIMIIDTKDEFIHNAELAAKNTHEKKRMIIKKFMQWLPNFTPEAEAYLRRKQDKYKI